GGALTRTHTEEMLGVVGRRTLFDIVEAIAADDAATVLACIQRLDTQTPDHSALLNDLTTILQHIAILQVLPNTQNDNNDPMLTTLAEKITPTNIQLYYQIIVINQHNLP